MLNSFSETGLRPEIIDAITELGFETPMPVQAQVIPLLLSNTNDLVGLAQTGTGKTAAFGLPLIQQVDCSDRSTQSIILAPTRELCVQIANDLIDYSKYVKGLTVLPVYGGASIEQQIRTLKKGVQIIVATPGRMLDLINRGEINIRSVNTVVLDEADEMLNMGFKDELDGILADTPATKRTLLFSATMSPEIRAIAKGYMKQPQEVVIGQRNAGAATVSHRAYMVHAKDRYLALKRIADFHPDIYGIIFCRTRQETREIAEKLIKDGYNADALHGDLSQAQRDHVMQRFRIKNIQMLVATDVAARGLDVEDLTHVIQYNLPDEAETYTHRSGRTGRAGKKGISVSIIHTREQKRLKDIERHLKISIDRHKVPTGQEICEKQLFNFIHKMETVVIDDSQIESFLPQVFKKLEWMSREDIIKQFVALEFNRFLDYYKNAADINVVETSSYRDDRSGGRGDSFGGRRAESGFERFFISLGHIDNIKPTTIIGLVNEYTRDRTIRIGRIEMKDKFSFFEADRGSSKKIIASLKNVVYQGRKIVISAAEPLADEGSAPRHYKKDRKGNDFKRSGGDFNKGGRKDRKRRDK